MEQCDHERLDFSRASGNGYVTCANCGKSIPVERALASIDKRLRRLERFMRLKVLADEVASEVNNDSSET